jgi:hypothetical protein
VKANGHTYKALPGKIPGTPVNLGGMDYIMPPLNLDQVQEFESIIPKLGQRPTLRENLEEALPLIHAALSRNYPEITIEDLRKILDLGNFSIACDALVTVSGYTKASAGEPAPASQ